MTRHEKERAHAKHEKAPVVASRGVEDAPGWVAPAVDLVTLDYVDCFQLATPTDRTAEQWARAIFGNRADAVQRFLWVGLLGLEVSRRASTRLVAGWPIDTATRDEIRLVTGSRGLVVNLIVRTDGSTVALATALHFRRRADGLRWILLSPLHRMLVPDLLRNAADRLARP